MKKLYTLLTFALLFTVVFRADAQYDQLIKSSPADVTKLLQAYGEPLFKGFGTSLNGGWNNTAQTKKFLHFDLRISASAAFVPISDQSFDVSKLTFNHLQIDPASPTNIAPTIGGNKSGATPLMRVTDNNGAPIPGSSFSLPKGQTSIIPAPNIQLTIGIFKNTDLTIRTTPTINISSDIGSVSVLGFGLKHDIIQDFAGKAPKPFDLAIAVNYNRVNYDKTLNIQPPSGSQPAPGTSAADFSTQSIDSHFSGLDIEGIISKRLLFFTPFFSAGYQSATTDFSLLGNYAITSTQYGSTFYTTINNPVHINETSISGLRADAGFQLNLSIVRFYASYSIAPYQSFNAGMGFGF